MAPHFQGITWRSPSRCETFPARDQISVKKVRKVEKPDFATLYHALAYGML